MCGKPLSGAQLYSTFSKHVVPTAKLIAVEPLRHPEIRGIRRSGMEATFHQQNFLQLRL